MKINNSYPLKLKNSSFGFTLIEILVSLVILTISLVTIMQLFSGGLKSSKIAGDYTKAIFLAREKMNQLLLEEDTVAKSIEEDLNNEYKWRAEIKPFNIMNEDEDDSKMPVKLFEIEVSVEKKTGGRRICLKTLKLSNSDEMFEMENKLSVQK